MVAMIDDLLTVTRPEHEERLRHWREKALEAIDDLDEPGS